MAQIQRTPTTGLFVWPMLQANCDLAPVHRLRTLVPMTCVPVPTACVLGSNRIVVRETLVHRPVSCKNFAVRTSSSIGFSRKLSSLHRVAAPLLRKWPLLNKKCAKQSRFNKRSWLPPLATSPTTKATRQPTTVISTMLTAMLIVPRTSSVLSSTIGSQLMK